MKANTIMGAGDKESREGTVERSVQDLGDEVSNLCEKIERLRARLESVCAPPSPTSVPGQNDKLCEVNSALTQKLESLRQRLRQLGFDTSELLGRLEV